MERPSKQIMFLMGTVGAFFLAFFGYGPIVHTIKNVSFNNTVSYKGSLGAVSGVSGNNPASDLDSDGDGLKDWQEVLWKTDPHNPDTDGDGTPDGQEVAEGRDPTKPGPNDKITHSLDLTATNNNSAVLGDPNNLSEQLSKNLFSQFMSANQTGQIDDTMQAQIIGNTLSNLKPEIIPTRFTLADIKTFDSGNKAKIKDFGNNLISIQRTVLSKITPGSSDETTYKVYSELLDQLSNLQVPDDLGLQYLTLLNNYYAIGELTKMMQQEHSDPVKSLLAVKSNQNLDTETKDIYTQFANYFRNSGIIWSNNEPGAVWKNL